MSFHLFKRYLMAFCLVCLSLSASIGAANDENISDEDHTDEQLMEMSIEQLLDVSISVASVKEETVAQTPAIVSRYEASDLQRFGVKTLVDMLQFIPGIRVTRNHFGQFTVSIRGIYESFNQKILFLLDGVPYYQVTHSMIPLFGIPIESIDHIEIIRGPGAVIYGTNASAGVIKVVTKKKDKNIVSVTGGSEHYTNLGGFLFQEINEKIKLSVGVESQSGGYFDSFQDQGLTISSLQGDIIFGQRVNSAFGNLDAYGTNLMISAFDVRYFGINQNSDPDSLGWTEEKSILGHINKTFLLSDSFNIKLFYDYNLYYPKFFAINQAGGTNRNVHFPNQENNYRSRVGTRFDFQLNESLSFTGGFEHEKRSHGDYEIHNDDNNVLITQLIPRNNLIEMGSFLQVDYLLSNWRFLLGARHTENALYGSETTPRASIVYGIDHSQSLKLLYAKGFNSPTPLQTRLLPSSPIVTGNPNLKPETITTIDFAYSYNFANTLFVANIYYLEANDTINRRLGSSGTPPLSYYNDFKFERYGLELDYQKVFKKWKLFSNASYLDRAGTQKDNDPNLVFAEKISLSVGSSCEINDNNIVGANYGYISSRKTQFETKKMSENHLVDVNYDYKINWLTARFSIKNLLNQEVRNASLAISNTTTFRTNPDREYYLQLKAEF